MSWFMKIYNTFLYYISRFIISLLFFISTYINTIIRELCRFNWICILSNEIIYL